VLGKRKAASLGFAPAWLIIEDCLYPGAQVDHTEVVSLNRLHRRASKWPRSLHGYLPYWPDMTIEGIRQWLKLTPTLGVKTKVLQSLNNMLHIVGPLVAPHFIVSYTLIDVAAHLAQASERMMDPETGNFDGTQISDLIQECRQYISLMHYFISKTLNETERRVFHHTAPDNMLVVYESIQLVLDCASSLGRQYRPEDVPRKNQEAISAMTEGVSQLQLDVIALARELYWDCSTRDVFASPHPTHADL
jgi:hypothetical protein